MHATRVASYIDILHNFKKTELLDKEGNTDPFPDETIKSLAKHFQIQEQDVLMLTKYAALYRWIS